MDEARRRIDVTTWVLAPWVALSAFACDASMRDDSCGSQVAGIVRVASWWSQDAESAEARALKGLSENFTHCNHDARADLDRDRYRDKAELMQKLDALPAQPSEADLNALPDVIQLNAGDTALEYVCGSRALLASFGDLFWEPDYWLSPAVGPIPSATPLGGALADGAVWFEPQTPPPSVKGANDEPWIYADRQRWILPHVSCGAPQQYQVVPIAVHHVNYLYYNIHLARSVPRLSDETSPPPVKRTTNLSLSKLPSPRPNPSEESSANLEDIDARLRSYSYQDWLELVAGPRGDGKPWLALPSDDASGWALNLLAAENIKIARNLSANRAPTFTSLDLARQVMTDLDTLRRASQLTPPAGERWSVQRAMQAVEEGEAVFTVMGDWAFKDMGPTKVGMIPFPSTTNALVYTIDGFVAVKKSQPDGAPMTPQSKAWLRTVSDKDVATEFAQTKGATAIQDWLDDTVGACARSAFEGDPNVAGDERDCWVVPAMSMRGQDCEAAESLLRWVQEPTIENQMAAESKLAACSTGAQAEGERP